MAKTIDVLKNDNRIIIGYLNSNNKVIASVQITNSGRYYEVDANTNGKENYGFLATGDDYYEVLYLITKFAAKNNLPYTDVEALKIWELRDAHMKANA